MLAALREGRPPVTPRVSTTAIGRSPAQFDLGVRQIELDVYADPQGGKYRRAPVCRRRGTPCRARPRVMRKPGFKVLHQAYVDTHSTCLTFVVCLHPVQDVVRRAPRTRADDDRGRDEGRDGGHGATFDALEAEIRSVFSPADLITPDDVRGNDPSLGHAVRTRGWPTLGAVRGRVLFTLDNEGLATRSSPATRRCAAASCSRRRRPVEDDAAFAKLNDPIGDAAKIKAALAANMLVRTRADADTVQARTDDTTMRDAALSGGAQFVSTDYEVPDPRFGPYVVKMPGGTPARCNPVTARPTCRPTDIEDPHSSAIALSTQSRVSMISCTRARNAPAYAPSIARWSNDKLR